MDIERVWIFENKHNQLFFGNEMTLKFALQHGIKAKFFSTSPFLEEPCGVLLVKLAGVELTESGKVWLQKELKPSQLLWFQLLGKENSALFCYLLVNKVSRMKKQ